MKDKQSSGQTVAALLLATDNTPESLDALRQALMEKNWTVRAAAARSVAIRNAVNLYDDVAALLADKKEEVEYSAAAALIRLKQPAGADQAGRRRAHGKMVNMKSGSIRLFAFILAACPCRSRSEPRRTNSRCRRRCWIISEYPCSNCFFGTSNHYYCFAAGNQVLIGRQRTPTMNWKNDTKNYFTKAYKPWAAWDAPGQTVQLSYDDKHIWVPRGDGKEVKLTQDYSRDIFSNPQCRGALKKSAK